MIDSYDWAGGREAMLRFGPATGPVVIAAMPLLEEWNRTRAFVVTLLRALAERGIASVLPDLPGHGESLATLPDLPQLRHAFAAAMYAGPSRAVLSVRSGTLLDVGIADMRRWHLAPVNGRDLLRDLDRVRLASGEEPRDGTVTIAGTPLTAAFLQSLEQAEVGADAHTVRLTTDPRPADRHLDGTPLWRRAEPGNDPALAATLADDIAEWLARCVA